jgi:hypothetical protein
VVVLRKLHRQSHLGEPLSVKNLREIPAAVAIHWRLYDDDTGEIGRFNLHETASSSASVRR